ncbi:hypothetical protein KIW84_022321 [Lathyrus oleraceus]|uniref:Uncharacterized protein n=1 Tax=Pisum sativum TaxID=3888 RepID=A0A9D4YCU8_PEA|nr:hypothetical protein KIW84_022321 [Pisum sativum]
MLPTNLTTEVTSSIQTTIREVPTSEIGEEEELDNPRHNAKFAARGIIKLLTVFTGFLDADWATGVNDRKYMAGQCVFLGETLVSCSSRKQKVVSRSCTKSKYMVLDDLATEIAWNQSLLAELKLPLSRKPILWCDNLSAKAMTSNSVMHARSKHIAIDVHYIRDQK